MVLFSAEKDDESICGPDAVKERDMLILDKIANGECERRFDRRKRE